MSTLPEHLFSSPMGSLQLANRCAQCLARQQVSCAPDVSPESDDHGLGHHFYACQFGCRRSQHGWASDDSN